MQGGGIATISLGSSATTYPTLSLSSYVEVNDVYNNGNSVKEFGDGALLGVNTSGTAYTGNFYGLLLDGLGELSLVHGTSIVASLQRSGPNSFSTNLAYDLSYTINTTTGAITSISLAGGHRELFYA